MKRSLFIASLASLVIPSAFARKSKVKRNLRIQQFGEEEPGDISVDGIFYSASLSFPYETAVLVGPEFPEGTQISKCYVQGVLESNSSFVSKLQRIVNALDETH